MIVVFSFSWKPRSLELERLLVGQKWILFLVGLTRDIMPRVLVVNFLKVGQPKVLWCADFCICLFISLCNFFDGFVLLVPFYKFFVYFLNFFITKNKQY